MWRIWTIFGVFALFFLVIVSRLFYWQIVRGPGLRLEAATQYFLEFSIPSSRGRIESSDGSPLVVNQNAYLVYAQPPKIKDIRRFARDVSTILHLDSEETFGKLSQEGRVWVPLAHKVDAQLLDALAVYKQEGLGFEKEPKRYYPEASMAAQLLGFVGSDQNGNDKGYFGLEGYYDRDLRGKDGSLQLEKDVRGKPILVGEAKRVEAEDGRTLVTWVDKTVERIVEKRLKSGIEKYGAKEGSVVVMDPKTGGVLAMASFPSYNPGDYTAFDKSVYKNPLVASSYEPGSTFKSLVMAAALNEKAVTPATTMEETGPVQIDEYSIRTWNNQYHGTITMMQVLEQSSNVGMVFVQRKLGKDPFVRYLRLFGFGQPTGVDLEEESSPQTRADNAWGEIDLATTSFGQGIAVTPLQMVRAVAALANDGWLMEPHVVKEIRDASGKVTVLKPKRVRQVISPDTAKVTTEMMVAAVDAGEAKRAKPPGYRIAGKTGTAQIPVAGHYDDKKTIASFVGFAPADDPRFVMLVTLREPSSSQWGSETAAPLFFAIAQDLFLYYGITPR